jgi:hypothetical protein
MMGVSAGGGREDQQKIEASIREPGNDAGKRVLTSKRGHFHTLKVSCVIDT